MYTYQTIMWVCACVLLLLEYILLIHNCSILCIVFWTALFKWNVSQGNSQQDIKNLWLHSYLVCGCIIMCLNRPFDGLLDGFQTWFL